MRRTPLDPFKTCRLQAERAESNQIAAPIARRPKNHIGSQVECLECLTDVLHRQRRAIRADDYRAVRTAFNLLVEERLHPPPEVSVHLRLQIEPPRCSRLKPCPTFLARERDDPLRLHERRTIPPIAQDRRRGRATPFRRGLPCQPSLDTT